MQFIVVVIGLFSVSEILLMLEHTSSGQTLVRKTGRMLFNAKEGAQCVGATLRSSVIGFFVGVLPGAGATIASAITYMTEKKLSGNSDSFGKGDIRGVAAPEAANNASACGSFIPMLTLGVPGSGTTAVMMGALTLYNITPGPAMFTEQPDIVWGLIAALLIANVMLLVMNIPLIGLFTRMLTIPLWFLVPAIAAVSAVPPSCATAARPPWATSPMCGRTGSNRAVGFSQKNHGQGFALCAALWYTKSQQ